MKIKNLKILLLLVAAFGLQGCLSVRDKQLFILMHVNHSDGSPVAGAKVSLWKDFRTTTNSSGCAFFGGKIGVVRSVKVAIDAGPGDFYLTEHSAGHYEIDVVLTKDKKMQSESWRKISNLTSKEWERACF